MKNEELKSFIKKNEWVFAKSYKDTFPHEYIVKNKENKKEFEEFIKIIREKGIKKRFFQKEFTYYYLDGYKYWTMGEPINKTIIINREEVNK